MLKIELRTSHKIILSVTLYQVNCGIGIPSAKHIIVIDLSVPFLWLSITIFDSSILLLLKCGATAAATSGTQKLSFKSDYRNQVLVSPHLPWTINWYPNVSVDPCLFTARQTYFPSSVFFTSRTRSIDCDVKSDLRWVRSILDLLNSGDTFLSNWHHVFIARKDRHTLFLRVLKAPRYGISEIITSSGAGDIDIITFGH